MSVSFVHFDHIDMARPARRQSARALYNRVTEPNGHHTDTYQAPGRLVSFTTYDDGSFTESIKSICDQPISGYRVTPVGSTTASLPTIPTGGSELIPSEELEMGDTGLEPVTSRV